LVNLVTLETSDQDALVDIIHFYFEIQVNNTQTNFTENHRIDLFFLVSYTR